MEALRAYLGGSRRRIKTRFVHCVHKKGGHVSRDRWLWWTLGFQARSLQCRMSRRCPRSVVKLRAGNVGHEKRCPFPTHSVEGHKPSYEGEICLRKSLVLAVWPQERQRQLLRKGSMHLKMLRSRHWIGTWSYQRMQAARRDMHGGAALAGGGSEIAPCAGKVCGLGVEEASAE